MSRVLSVLLILSLCAVSPARAAEEPETKQKSGSKIERSVDKAGAAMGRTADRAERSVKKGVAATEKTINTAGKKTGQWINEKTK